MCVVSTPFKHEISLKYNNKLLSSTKLDFSFFFLLLYNLDPDKLILGDPGADKGGEGKSKQAEKYIWNEEK